MKVNFKGLAMPLVGLIGLTIGDYLWITYKKSNNPTSSADGWLLDENRKLKWRVIIPILILIIAIWLLGGFNSFEEASDNRPIDVDIKIEGSSSTHSSSTTGKAGK